MAIRPRLVELMEGRIWIESTVGTGSTFHFTVRVTVSATAPDKPRPLHPGLLQGLRVLVVDDNSTNRRILAEMLSNWGMVPILAASANEALTLLAEHETEENSFALLLTDVQMPELSGFDLVRRARIETLFAKGVVMMLTLRRSGERSQYLLPRTRSLDVPHQTGQTIRVVRCHFTNLGSGDRFLAARRTSPAPQTEPSVAGPAGRRQSDQPAAGDWAAGTLGPCRDGGRRRS